MAHIVEGPKLSSFPLFPCRPNSSETFMSRKGLEQSHVKLHWYVSLPWHVNLLLLATTNFKFRWQGDAPFGLEQPPFHPNSNLKLDVQPHNTKEGGHPAMKGFPGKVLNEMYACLLFREMVRRGGAMCLNQWPRVV